MNKLCLAPLSPVVECRATGSCSLDLTVELALHHRRRYKGGWWHVATGHWATAARAGFALLNLSKGAVLDRRFRCSDLWNGADCRCRRDREGSQHSGGQLYVSVLLPERLVHIYPTCQPRKAHIFYFGSSEFLWRPGTDSSSTHAKMWPTTT